MAKKNNKSNVIGIGLVAIFHALVAVIVFGLIASLVTRRENYQMILPNNSPTAKTPFDVMNIGGWNGLVGASTNARVSTTGAPCPCIASNGGFQKTPITRI
jgi:hypothetical protein